MSHGCPRIGGCIRFLTALDSIESKGRYHPKTLACRKHSTPKPVESRYSKSQERSLPQREMVLRACFPQAAAEWALHGSDSVRCPCSVFRCFLVNQDPAVNPGSRRTSSTGRPVRMPHRGIARSGSGSGPCMRLAIRIQQKHPCPRVVPLHRNDYYNSGAEMRSEGIMQDISMQASPGRNPISSSERFGQA
jgi:hypothetical protein